MSQALVLNATYAPLTVVPARRALVLLLKEKADVIQSNGAIFHSENVTMDAPSVIRLRNFVRVPFQRGIPLTRRGVFARDDWECQYCGRDADNIDHITPKSKGGAHSWENVVASCLPCNDKKGNKTLREVGFQLRKLPVAPKGGSWLASSRHRPEWEEFLNPGPK